MSTQRDFDIGHTLADVVAANIRARAAYLGLSQIQIARELGWSKTTVQQRWHAGSRPWKIEDLEALAPLLGVEPWELLRSDTRKGSPSRTALRSLYTARDSNPEPTGSEHSLATVVHIDTVRQINRETTPAIAI